MLLETYANDPVIQYTSIIMIGIGSDGCEGVQLLQSLSYTAVIYGMSKAVIRVADYIVD